MPTVTSPVSSHSGQVAPSLRPLPPQPRHTVSPVPGVPGGASSPGEVGAAGWDGSRSAAPRLIAGRSCHGSVSLQTLGQTAFLRPSAGTDSRAAHTQAWPVFLLIMSLGAGAVDPSRFLHLPGSSCASTIPDAPRTPPQVFLHQRVSAAQGAQGQTLEAPQQLSLGTLDTRVACWSGVLAGE